MLQKTICDKYRELDSRINVIHKSNEGLSQARNDGMKIARGEYLIFIDSDDWILKESLVKVNELIKINNNPDLIINRIKSYYSDTKTYSESKYIFPLEIMKAMDTAEIFEYCYKLPEFWAAAWIFIVKRNYIYNNNLYFAKGLLHEDEEWAPKLILNSEKIAFNNECFYCNRANRIGSITQSVNIKKEFDKLKIIDRIIEESKENNYNKKQKSVLLSRCSSLYQGVIMNLLLYKENDLENYKELVVKLKNKKQVLLLSKRKSHLITYLLCCSIGVLQTSKIINKIGEK